MSLLLIDDQGTLWDGGSRQLREAFDSPYSGGEFAEYAVLNLGFVAINTYGSSCQIRLRPSIVAEAAAAALKQWLTSGPCGRAVLTAFGTDWTSELIGSSIAALQRIDAVIVEGRRARPNDFLAREVAPGELDGVPSLAEIVAHWPHLAKPSGQRRLLHLLEQAFGDRYVVVKKDTAKGPLVFHELGNGLFTNYETWRSCAVGAPVEEQPDRNYGRWIAGTYNEAIKASEPRAENVDAIVRWPHAGRTRLRYKRLLVPLQWPGAPPMLLSASVLDKSIDLRVAG
jgi:hypothetical protein